MTALVSRAPRASLARLHRGTLLITAALAAASVMGGSTALVLGALGLWGVLLIAAPALHQPERTGTARMAVHGLTGLALLVLVRMAFAADTDAVFLVLMLGIANRVLLRTGARDDLVVMGAASVLMAAGTVVTSGLAYLFIVLAILPAIVGALWTTTMLAATETTPLATRPVALAEALRAPAPWGFGWLALGAIVVTGLGFGVSFIFPRYRFTPFLTAGSLGSLPGASDAMELKLGGIGDLDDATVVVRLYPIEAVGPGGLDGLYAKLYALDRFDGRRFLATSEGHLPPLGSIKGTPAFRVVQERLSRSGVHHPAAVIGRTAPWASVGSGLHMDSGGTQVVDQGAWRNVEYSVFPDQPPLPAMMGQRRQAEALSRELELPAGTDPRILALAEQLVAGKEGDRVKAEALVAHFGTAFEYSTEPLAGSEQDPLVRFLFEAKKGHCELYAGALAVLARAAGLRARVASGYYGGTWNELGEFLALRQGDAHAWVEIYLEGEGWQWFDATPPALRPRGSTSLLMRVRDWWDVANAVWFNRVVDYDGRRQREVYERVGFGLEKMLRDPGGFLGGKWGELSSGAAGGGAALLAVALVAAVVVLRRRRDPGALGVRLRRLLDGEGHDDLPLARLLELGPSTPERLEAVRAYEAWRFGGRADEERARLGAAERAIQALARAERARRRGGDAQTPGDRPATT